MSFQIFGLLAGLGKPLSDSRYGSLAGRIFAIQLIKYSHCFAYDSISPEQQLPTTVYLQTERRGPYRQ